MCGIVYKSNFFTNTDINLFIKATEKLKARGPDDFGYLFNKEHSFGHRRLRKDDYSLQPISILNSHLMLDGSIYNYEELCKILEEPLDFKSDSLLLLKLLNKYNNDILNKLSGIFSFVYTTKDEVLIVRDMFGVKPLYYSFIGEDIIVASEIKALLEYTDNRVIDDEGLCELLGMGPSHSLGKTIYKGIYELKPGHLIKGNINGFNIVKYYEIPTYVVDLPYEELVERIRTLVDSSISNKVDINKPIASFLSGGLDSSVVSVILSDLVDCLNTYSINYTNSEFKENTYEKSLDSEFTKIMSAFIYSHQNDVFINDEELIEGLKSVVHIKDSPTMTDIDSSLAYLCNYISEKYKFALSGECSDEVFAGYPWYKEKYKFESFPWIRNIELRESLLNDKYRRKLKLKQYVKEEYEKALSEAPTLINDDLVNNERKLTYLNLRYFMLNLLDRNDRISSRFGLEVGVPFCDKELVEFLYNVPYKYKSIDGTEKRLLRDAYKDKLPIEVINRKKSPYPKCNSKKYDEKVKELFIDVLKDESSILYKIFDKDKLYQLIYIEEIEPWYGQLMRKTALLAYLFQIDYWFKEYKMRLED